MSSPAPDSRTSPAGPSQIPRGALPGTGPILKAADACVNFNLPDSRVVCLSVPVGITPGDAEFILALLQAHVTAVMRRGH